MVLVTPGMWEVVSREAWQVSICSTKMQSSQAALVWPIVLLPMPLLVYCHTCKQCGHVGGWKFVQEQSIGVVALPF